MNKDPTDLLKKDILNEKGGQIMLETVNPEKREGPVARAIEEQTAKIPSDVFLWAAIGAMAVSLTLKMMGKNSNSLFVGQWPAPFLLMGLYNKIVKVEGHDRQS